MNEERLLIPSGGLSKHESETLFCLSRCLLKQKAKMFNTFPFLPCFPLNLEPC